MSWTGRVPRASDVISADMRKKAADSAVSVYLDFEGLFARALYDEINEVFGRHGIEELYEDELDGLVRECVSRCYGQSIEEFGRWIALGMTRL